MKLLFGILLAVSILLFGASPWSVMAAPQQEHDEMLYPAVQITSAGAIGSGTVIYSAVRDAVACELEDVDDQPEVVCTPLTDASGGPVRQCHSYIVTNFHVVQRAIEVLKTYDPKLKLTVDKETRYAVDVAWWQYNDLSRAVRTEGAKADIVGYDKKADLALLRVRDFERCMDNVAHLLPEGEKMFLFERVWAVGAGLGQPPFPTDGMLANLETEIKGHPYLLATAPIIFGNSGGALYRFSDERQRFEMIGLPSRVSAAMFTVVSHMGWSIRIDTLRAFLRDNNVGFIVDG